MGCIESSSTHVIDLKGKPQRVLDDFTVIIPTVGRRILEKCLESVSNGSCLPRSLILIDQGQNPLVPTWLNNLAGIGVQASYFRSSKRSPSSARNLAIEQIRSSFVAAIDEDCVAENNWLENMEIQLRNNPSAIITGRVLPAGEGMVPSVVTSMESCVYDQPSLRVHSQLASGNMGFALQTARKIGPFDENLKAAEDNDWGYRALHIGIPIIFAPEIIVYHFHWRDAAQLIETYQNYAWGQGAFFGKHLRKGDLAMILRSVLFMYRGIRSLIYGVVSGDFNRRIYGRARIARFLPGLISGFRGLTSL
jgi:glycosyltransferase involved in cell wall biosynthesis